MQKANYVIQKKNRCREYKLHSSTLYPFQPFYKNLSALRIIFWRIFAKNNTETNEYGETSHFPRYTFPSIFIFCNDNETAPLRHTTCWRTTVPWDANVISLEILMRARGWRTGIGFGVGMTRREERRMSRLSQASLFGFSPSRDLPTFSRREIPSSSLSRESRLSSHFSLVTLSSFLGGVPRDSVVPRRGYILSSRNNKLTLLNLSWAAFRSSSLRQQRAPAYLPTNIVTAFNSVIYIMLHAF